MLSLLRANVIGLDSFGIRTPLEDKGPLSVRHLLAPNACNTRQILLLTHLLGTDIRQLKACNVAACHRSGYIMQVFDVENIYAPTASKLFNIMTPHYVCKGRGSYTIE